MHNHHEQLHGHNVEGCYYPNLHNFAHMHQCPPPKPIKVGDKELFPLTNSEIYSIVEKVYGEEL